MGGPLVDGRQRKRRETGVGDRSSARRRVGVLLALVGVEALLVSALASQPAPPACGHPGRVVEGADVMQPVLEGRPDRIRTEWLRYLPDYVFGPRRLTVAVSFRVDEKGSVTSACVDRGAEGEVGEAVRQSLLALRFTEAERDGRAVPVLVRQEIELIRSEGYFAAEVSVDATDEAWLERIAIDPASEARIRESNVLNRLYRDIRVHAFARLGELGTAEALAAIERVERRISETVQTPTMVSLRGYAHPAWHYGDEPGMLLAETDRGGVRVAVTPNSLLGGMDLFLVTNQTPRDETTWTRPILVPVKWTSAAYRDTHLSVAPGGRLVLSVGERRHVLDPVEIARDGDGDGWTDIEEARLGLRADLIDSDGDGIPDGRDVCPLLPEASETATGDERDILRSALHGVFAVGGSRFLLLVDDPSPRVHMDGYGGPVLYGVDRDEWAARHGTVGVRVSWRILERTEGEAVVEIRDLEGLMAAGGQKVYLRKAGSRWVVVGRVPTWVS